MKLKIIIYYSGCEIQLQVLREREREGERGREREREGERGRERERGREGERERAMAASLYRASIYETQDYNIAFILTIDNVPNSTHRNNFLIHVYTKECIHVYIKECIYVYTKECIHVYIKECIYVYTKECIHVYIKECIYVQYIESNSLI